MQPKEIAKVIRKNLTAQKSRLKEYLKILDHEKEDIINEDPDKLIAHIELEHNIIDELSSFKKILDPLEIMYFNSPFKKQDDIIDIKKDIEMLTDHVKIKSVSNREKLDSVLFKVKADLKGMNKKKVSRNSYTEADSTLVDING